MRLIHGMKEMSKPKEMPEFKVQITVTDVDTEAKIVRNYKYSPTTTYTAEIQDMVDTHLEALDL